MSTLNTYVPSRDGRIWICKTCDLKVRKCKVPCQAVHNNLFLSEIPDELSCLNKLERFLICKRFLFKKVVIMPKGQCPKLKGAVVNVPVDANNTYKQLPCCEDVILLKLKKKLAFKGHVFFESVRPQKVRQALLYLRSNNPLYDDINIDVNKIPDDLLSLSEEADELSTNDLVSCADEIELNSLDDILSRSSDQVGSSDNISQNDTISPIDILEDVPNPLDVYRSSANESLLVGNNQIYEISPGEDHATVNMLLDDNCEELAFPYFFSEGNFGYTHQREVKLDVSKYINQRLLNFSQRFASSSDYIFWAQALLQQKFFHEKISMALRKKTGGLTAGMFSNYKESLQQVLNADEGFLFMSQIRGTPAYWKRFQSEVLAMVKQLGCPSFFLTLSCADLRWNELVEIINDLNGLNMDVGDMNNLNYFERCEVLNFNPVLLARHFQYRVETFFREIIMISAGPLPKVQYYAIRVEFQVRGSPHIHSFLWLLNPPELSDDSVDDYIEYLDSVVHANLPSYDEDPLLHNLVKTYQVHSHSKSCRKYKNKPCRYHFGRFFSERTIIARPLTNVSDYERFQLLQRRKGVLDKVSSYINTSLCPDKADLSAALDIDTVLNQLKISKDEYYWALSISEDNDYQVHLKRKTNSCFVNNYNPIMLKAWQANIDLQPVYNYFKAITYMATYFSKSENETSQALKEAVEQINDQNLRGRKAMQKLAYSFITTRQLSVQEAVYFCLPELWLRKCCPGIMFVNTNLPGSRYRILKSEEEISQLAEDSEDIFKNGIIERYIDRPNSFHLNQLCLAQFAAIYHKGTPELNDYQPSQIENNDVEVDLFSLPKRIRLQSSEIMVRRNRKLVLRYYKPNMDLHPEKYAHHILMLFYPFRSEDDLISDGKFTEKLAGADVFDVVNRNKEIFEPNSDLIDAYWLQIQNNENVERRLFEEDVDETNEPTVTPTDPILDSNTSQQSTGISAPSIVSDKDLSIMICSLNQKQRQVFDYICDWGRKKLRLMNSGIGEPIDPLRLFITGGAGVGKSHLVKTIAMFLTKNFNLHAGSPEKPKVLLLAPTGVAAINIDGTTINTGLGIPPNVNGYVLPRLSDLKRSELRNLYSDIIALIVDEISMVSNVRLLQIHLRLCDVFGCATTVPFAGLTILVVGDLYQLPPIKSSQVFSPYNCMFGDLFQLWSLFVMCELTEVMRQKGDARLIDLLNRVRVGNTSENDIALLNSRNNQFGLIDDCTMIFAENQPKDEYNYFKLGELPYPEIIIKAIDKVPAGTPLQLLDSLKKKSQSSTGGLASDLVLKKGAKVMLTTNVNIAERLINGQMGVIYDFAFSDSAITKVYVKFDDAKAGLVSMLSDEYARRNLVVPVTLTASDISLGSSGRSYFLKRTQFPLMLAWACTIHKVQGLTLEKVVLSTELRRQKKFGFGQIYVALSRTTSIDNLFLLGDVTDDLIQASPLVKQEYSRLRCDANFFSIFQKRCDSLLVLLNIRGLLVNLNDFCNDKRLLYAPIICFTETQTTEQSDLSLLEHYFPSHKALRNDNEDKYSSLLTLYNSCCFTHMETQNFNGITYVSFRSQLLSIPDMKILLVYRKNKSNVLRFSELLNYLVTSKDIDIVLGDFNTDFSTDGIIETALTDLNFTHHVSESTHLRGSLLDHVYIRNTFDQIKLKAVVKSVYYSDHEAVQLCIA